VIIPTFTIMSCALAIVRAGGVPVLIDADPDTWCLDAAQLEARISPRTRAIMPVHIYGHPCDMNAILSFAERFGLAVIEDAAEAHGAECELAANGGNWRRCGSFGTMSAFSFYANKLVTTGEGGMILTDDSSLAGRLRSQRNLAFGTQNRFEHEALGHQYRFTNLQAAIGVPQIKRMPDLLARKRWMASAYSERLRDVGSIETQVTRAWARPMHWMYGIVLRDDARIDAGELATRLTMRGIETRPFFLGMHEQPALRARGLFAGDTYPVAERLARRGLYLPSGLGLTEIQLERVCDTLCEVVG
jgi:perosamine synthetase